MIQLTRREFLERKMSLVAAAFAAQVPAWAESKGRKRGPNGKIRIGCVGVKGRGIQHVKSFAGMKDVEVAAIADIDQNVIGEAMQAAQEGSGKKPAFYQDVRRMLDKADLAAVSIATCNHTHTLISLWALQAGKHVYVEKPLSHNVREGTALADAAKKTGLVVQHGTQGRSSAGLQQMIQYLRSEELGPLTAVRGFCYKRRTSIGKSSEGPVPSGVNHDLWLGPAPQRPYASNRFHYNWHWYWDYGNGDIGNQGVHEMDRARWGLGATVHPKRILSVGGRLGYEDSGETPNTSISYFDYGSVPLVFEVRGLDTDAYKDCRIGVIYDCKGGWIMSPSYDSATAFDLKGNVVKTFGGGGDHFRAFIDAVLAQKPEMVSAPPQEGRLTASLGHLANISYRVGAAASLADKKLPFDHEVPNEAFRRMRDHLKSQGLDAKTTSYQRGQTLEFDGASEKLPGSPTADALLTRDYRKGFELPSFS